MPPLEPELPEELDDDELGLELPDEPDDEDEALGIEGDELPELPDDDALGMLGAPELLEDDCCCVDSQLASSMLIAAAWARTRACLRNFDTLMM